MGLNLIVDFDSTIVKVEALDVLAKIISMRNSDSTLPSRVKEITEQGMRGEISFQDSLKKRLEILNFHQSDLVILISMLKSNITETFSENIDSIKSKVDTFSVISGGFEDFILPVTSNLKIDQSEVFANKFLFNNIGKFLGIDENRPLAKDKGKVQQVKDLGLSGTTIVIGDGFTDYEIKQEGLADLFIAFTGNIYRSEVVSKADHTIKDFDEVMHILNSV